MIYRIRLRNDYNEEKDFFLTAEDHSKLYKRVLSTYGIPKNKVEILEEYKESDDWGYKLIKSNISHLTADDMARRNRALEIFNDNRCKDEPHKTNALERGYKIIEDINDENDILPLLDKYKKIKVYWEHTEKRGKHRYYALVK